MLYTEAGAVVFDSVWMETDGKEGLDLVIKSSLTPGFVEPLSQLQELEYLFLPGFMLTDRAMDTFEKMPALRHLHAPFSVVDAALLQRIVGLDNLKTLSIGISEQESSRLDVLRELEHLEKLQITVFVDEFFKSAEYEEKAEALLRRLASELLKKLPKCKIYVKPISAH